MGFLRGLRQGFLDRRAGLRTDAHGFSTGAVVGVLVGGMIAILIGYILVPVIAAQEYVAAHNLSTVGNATRTGVPGASGLLPLGPLMFILTVVVVPVVLVLYILHQAE